MGSLVIGDKNFITLFKHNRKMLGGVVRKPGVLANAALVALKTMPQQLGKDNEIAQLLSKKMV
jgi:threonine aldolase